MLKKGWTKKRSETYIFNVHLLIKFNKNNFAHPRLGSYLPVSHLIVNILLLL